LIRSGGQFAMQAPCAAHVAGDAFPLLPTPAAVDAQRACDEEVAFEATRRATLFGGFLLVLLGCLSGFMFVFLPAAGDRITKGPTPAVGVAHQLGCLEGVLLIAIAAAWHLVHLNARNRNIAAACCLIHAYGNWLGTFVAAWKHASAAAFDPSFTCSMMNQNKKINLLVDFLLNLSALIIPLMWMLMLGTVAKDRRWCSQLLISIVAWVLIAVCAVVIVLSLFAPVVDPLIDPKAVDKNWPYYSNVKNIPYCPYAVMRPDDYVPVPP